MSYKARDGRIFPSVVQGRAYDRSLAERGGDDVEAAPGGPQHEHDLKTHGIAKSIKIEYDGPGRWRHTSEHADGYKSTSVHPEAYRAHEVAKNYLGIEPPPAVQTHARSRAHPVGPKESERLDAEDGRVVGQSKWSDFEDDK